MRHDGEVIQDIQLHISVISFRRCCRSWAKVESTILCNPTSDDQRSNDWFSAAEDATLSRATSRSKE